MPVPEAAAKPSDILLLVQVYVAPRGLLTKFVAATEAPLQTFRVEGTVTVEGAETVTTTLMLGPLQDPTLGITV